MGEKFVNDIDNKTLIRRHLPHGADTTPASPVFEPGTLGSRDRCAIHYTAGSSAADGSLI